MGTRPYALLFYGVKISGRAKFVARCDVLLREFKSLTRSTEGGMYVYDINILCNQHSEKFNFEEDGMHDWFADVAQRLGFEGLLFNSQQMRH